MRWERHDKEADKASYADADDRDRILSGHSNRDTAAYASCVYKRRNCDTAGECTVHGGVCIVCDGIGHCGYISVLVYVRAVCDPAADPDRRAWFYDDRSIFCHRPEEENRPVGAGHAAGECKYHADRGHCKACEEDHH